MNRENRVLLISFLTFCSWLSWCVYTLFFFVLLLLVLNPNEIRDVLHNVILFFYFFFFFTINILAPCAPNGRETEMQAQYMEWEWDGVPEPIFTRAIREGWTFVCTVDWYCECFMQIRRNLMCTMSAWTLFWSLEEKNTHTTQQKTNLGWTSISSVSLLRLLQWWTISFYRE